MHKLVIELSNRCNLVCQHCFSGRHGGRQELSIDLLSHILGQARALGFKMISYTGGEPTLHREFAALLRLTVDNGFPFGINTNGWNFVDIYHLLIPYAQNLQAITFSMEGATAEAHDRVRGKGSYRRLLQAMSVCTVQGLPFSINMTLTTANRGELDAVGDLAVALGAKALRFGHIMPTTLTAQLGWDIPPAERKALEARVWRLRDALDIPVSMAAGHYTTDLFPCRPLHLEEMNVDCQGNLTACCMLSGHTHGAAQSLDVVANLADVALADAVEILRARNAALVEAKAQRMHRGNMQDTDYFPCWYCSNYYNKVDWLRSQDNHPWSRHLITDLNSTNTSPTEGGTIDGFFNKTTHGQDRSDNDGAAERRNSSSRYGKQEVLQLE